MPVWQADIGIAVKVMTSFPANAQRGRDTSAAALVLFDAESGALIAVMAAKALTALRTAATSALAAQLLAPEACSTLLVVGAGTLAPYLAEAHCAIRPIERTLVWARDRARAASLVQRLQHRLQMPVELAESLSGAVASSDVVTVATRSEEPLIRAADVRPGTHIDLVGSYTVEMQECDTALVARARVVVDDLSAVVTAGELVRAVELAAKDAGDIADLSAVVRSEAPVPKGVDITLFKSVGCGLEDLYSARFILERHRLKSNIFVQKS